MLSEDQQRAFDIFVWCEFIIMDLGTGKSVLIRSIYRHARESKTIQICAMTGVAAANLCIRFKNIHSGGIGLGKGKHTEIIEKVATNKYKCKFWRSVDL